LISKKKTKGVPKDYFNCPNCKNRVSVLCVVPLRLVELFKFERLCFTCDTLMRNKFAYELEQLAQKGMIR